MMVEINLKMKEKENWIKLNSEKYNHHSNEVRKGIIRDHIYSALFFLNNLDHRLTSKYYDLYHEIDSLNLKLFSVDDDQKTELRKTKNDLSCKLENELREWKGVTDLYCNNPYIQIFFTFLNCIEPLQWATYKVFLGTLDLQLKGNYPVHGEPTKDKDFFPHLYFDLYLESPPEADTFWHSLIDCESLDYFESTFKGESKDFWISVFSKYVRIWKKSLNLPKAEKTLILTKDDYCRELFYVLKDLGLAKENSTEQIISRKYQLTYDILKAHYIWKNYKSSHKLQIKDFFSDYMRIDKKGNYTHIDGNSFKHSKKPKPDREILKSLDLFFKSHIIKINPS